MEGPLGVRIQQSAGAAWQPPSPPPRPLLRGWRSGGRMAGPSLMVPAHSTLVPLIPVLPLPGRWLRGGSSEATLLGAKVGGAGPASWEWTWPRHPAGSSHPCVWETRAPVTHELYLR